MEKENMHSGETWRIRPQASNQGRHQQQDHAVPESLCDYAVALHLCRLLPSNPHTQPDHENRIRERKMFEGRKK